MAASVLTTADAVLMTRLLNVFLREVGGAAAFDGCGGGAQAGEKSVRIALPKTSRHILVGIRRASSVGHHELDAPMYVVESSGAEARPVTGPLELAELLVAELVARGTGETHVEGVLDDIRSSIENTRRFVAEASANADWTKGTGADAFVRAEQAVVFGHPFHPSAKASDERWSSSLGRYRPELGGRFRLEYLAVHPALVRGELLDGVSEPVPCDVRDQAAPRLPRSGEPWALLPCHPWQARHLAERPDIAEHIARGRVVPLGPLGEEVFPTSSVRTVYLPRSDVFFKLPVDVRITNFVRRNPAEHVERTLVASRVLRRLTAAEPLRGVEILHELGYRALASDDDAFASSAVLFREGLSRAPSPPLVLAALLDPGATGEPPIAELVFEAARRRGSPMTADFVCTWLAAYVDISLTPLLGLYARHGVSLEAHAQNTLLATRDGWPSRVYVRDLEGTSISRERARRTEYFGGLVSPSSPVLVDESEAWKRLCYYVVTNQLAHLVATLAACTPADEWQLWQVVRGTLEDAGSVGRDLLELPELPAKANWVSRMGGRSETPLYVPIPNPLRIGLEP